MYRKSLSLIAVCALAAFLGGFLALWASSRQKATIAVNPQAVSPLAASQSSIAPQATATSPPIVLPKTANRPDDVRTWEKIGSWRGTINDYTPTIKEIHPVREWQLGFVMTGEQKAEVVVNDKPLARVPDFTDVGYEKGSWPGGMNDPAWGKLGELYAKWAKEELRPWLNSAKETIHVEGNLAVHSKIYPAGKYSIAFQLGQVIGPAIKANVSGNVMWGYIQVLPCGGVSEHYLLEVTQSQQATLAAAEKPAQAAVATPEVSARATVATPDKSAHGAATTVPEDITPPETNAPEWKALGWDGSRWAIDISHDCRVEKIADNHWRLTNNYTGWAWSVVYMDNLDARQGAVEFEAKSSHGWCGIELRPQSREDRSWYSPKLVKDTWYKVRLEIKDNKGFLSFSDQPTELNSHDATPDCCLPALACEREAVVEIRNVRQMKAEALIVATQQGAQRSVENPASPSKTVSESPTVAQTPATSAPTLLASTKPEPARTLTLNCGNGVTMRLTLIPGGEFVMGSPANEAFRNNDEKQHRVKITKPFYMGIYLVTQAQYEAVMGTNPAHFKAPNNPVEQMSWDGAQGFCKKLSASTGKTVRLPTEAEWEYACRAGTATAYAFGNTISTRQANSDGKLDCTITFDGKTTKVGSFPPNAWGLYDMHGNLWECCHDWYDSGYYGNSPLEDPTGPASGPYHVYRGGSWANGLGFARSACRHGGDTHYPYMYVGFRIVCGCAQ